MRSQEKDKSFQPDPEGNQIDAFCNLVGIVVALDRLKKAEKLLCKARQHPNRTALNTEAEREYHDAHDRVDWWLGNRKP